MESERAPWMAEDAFPLKPEGSEYGYLSSRGLKPCTKDELVARFERRRFLRTRLVWSPEHPRLVPPADLPWLCVFLTRNLYRKLRGVKVLSGIAFVLFGIGLLAGPKQNLPFVLANFILFGVIPLVWASRRRRMLAESNPAEAPLIRRNARFYAWMGGRRVVSLWLLLGCLGAGGMIQAAVGFDRAIDAAGFDRSMVHVGDYWRLVTGSLLHLNFWHFLSNLVTIAIAGWAIEALTTRYHLPIVFFASCLAGGLASLPFHEVTVGASDVASAFLGCLTVLAIAWRRHLPAGAWKWMMWLLASELVAEIYNKGEVNHAAHAAGLLVGAAAGILLANPHTLMPRFWMNAGKACAGLIIAATLGVVIATTGGHRGIAGDYELAVAAHNDGDLHLAEGLYTEILIRNPLHAESLYSRATARWGLDAHDNAKSDFDAYLEIVPDDPEALQYRGVIRAEMGDLEGSVIDLDRALELDSERNEGLVDRAWVHFLRGKFDLARRDVDRALIRNSKDAYALNTRGQIKHAEGDTDGALADLAEAIRLDGDHEYAFAVRGEIRWGRGDLEGAQADFKRALEVDEEDPEALLGRGRVRIAEGDLAGARADLAAALKHAHRWWRRRAETEAALRGIPPR